MEDNKKKWVVSLNNFDKGLATVFEYICTFMLIACIGVILMAVFCRFVIHFSTPWSEEFTRFTWIAMAFLGMGACLTKNEHIEIDVFAAIARKVKDLDKRYLLYKADDLFRYIFIGGLGGVLFKMYFVYTVKQKMMNQISAGLHLPMWILYVALTVGFFMLVLHCITNIIMIIGDYKVVRDKSTIVDAVAEKVEGGAQ